MREPDKTYLIQYVDSSIAPIEVNADGFVQHDGLIRFHIQSKLDSLEEIAFINARAIAIMTVSDYAPPEAEDPGPTLHDSSFGWDPSMVSSGNPYVRSVNLDHLGDQGLEAPFDPFRGNQLKEKK